MPALRSFAGAGGVRLLLSDSTNAESEGHTQSEKVVRETFHEIFSEAKGRIVITLFSSHIERIQMVFDMAREFDRAVVVSGRSLVNNIERGPGSWLHAYAARAVYGPDHPRCFP